MKGIRSLSSNICCFILLVLFGSCSLEKYKCSVITDIDAKSVEVNLSDICTDIQYIALDSKVPIDAISRMQITSDRIILKSKANGILLFDLNGHFISKVGKYGKGPGEYLFYRSKFTINNLDEKIYVLNNYKKVLVYDNTGCFISDFDIDIDFSPNDIFNLSNNQLLFVCGNSSGNTKYNWVVTTTDGTVCYKKENHVFFKATKYAGPSPAQISFKLDTSFIYFEQYNDTIFQINSNSFTPYAMLNLGDKRLTAKLSEKNGPLKTGSKYFLPRNMFCVKNQLFMEYIFNRKKKLTKYNKLTEKLENIKTSDSFGFINDVDNGLSFLPFIEYRCDDKLIDVFYPYELKQHVASNAFKNSKPKYPEKKKELEKLANRLNENDNPVLMLVKIKDE